MIFGAVRVRYDAAIIGAGADGLAAAALLARAGLKTVVVERAAAPGGRLVTETFHPGFRASPFTDRIAEIPPPVAALVPLPPLRPAAPLPADLRMRRDAALARLVDEARSPRVHGPFACLRRMQAQPVFPGHDLATRRRADWPEDADAVLAAADPLLAGTAPALLARAEIEAGQGGLGSLGAAFAAAASYADLRCGWGARAILLKRGRAAGLVLADGSRIAADAVISTLDFKRSVALLAGAAPRRLARAADAFRMGGGVARLLLALKRPLPGAPLLLAGDGNARAAWRRGAIPECPPLLADPVSARDASLAPDGAATVTVTLGCMPARPADGGWTRAQRTLLAARALARLETVRPGMTAALAHVAILVPPDIEARLGVHDGDLDGGALAADQMLGLRPGARMPVEGFYLGGRSAAAGPLGTGAAGFVAATALLADRR